MCMIDDGEPVTILTHRTPRKARKEHACSECRRVIAKGETYDYTSYIMEGDMFEHHLCDRCKVPAAWLSENCSGFCFEMVGEDILEHAREYRDLSLARQWVGMRRKWKSFMSDGLMAMPKQAPPITV